MVKNRRQNLLSYEYLFVVEFQPQCFAHDDCTYPEVCNKGNCINACRIANCGSNSKCETGLHSATCKCLPGFTGNPKTACTLCK